ncbi:MAG: hypothetical protein SF029_12335 [bacterium]|nr:hypothetical protein [bacterium]
MTDDPRIQQASRLILEGEYDRARQLLLEVDSPEARKWLAQIPSADEMDGLRRPREQAARRRILGLLLGLALIATLAFAGLFAMRARQYVPLYRATQDAVRMTNNWYMGEETRYYATNQGIETDNASTIQAATAQAAQQGNNFSPTLAPEFIQATNIVGTATAQVLILTVSTPDIFIIITETPTPEN